MWRRRYGDEVAAMLADQRFSLRVAVDLIAGAIDTWLHPAATLAAAAAATPPTEEEKHMLTKMLRLECAQSASALTTADHVKSALSLIACTAILTLAWTGLVRRFPDNPWVESLSALPILFGVLYSTRYTYLKDRSASVQVAFIGGFTLIVALILLTAGLINA
jgi:hypothetical protein